MSSCDCGCDYRTGLFHFRWDEMICSYGEVEYEMLWREDYLYAVVPNAHGGGGSFVRLPEMDREHYCHWLSTLVMKE